MNKNIINIIKKKLLVFVLPAFLFLLIAPNRIHAREFLNTFMHINFGVAYGSPSGSLIDTEERSFSVQDGDEIKRPDHSELSFSATVDLVPFDPWIMGVASNAVKFGVRGVYRFSYLKQELVVDSDTTYEGDLISYRSWLVGPVIHYAPVISPSGMTGDYTARGGFTFFILYGQIHSGTLTAFPAKRDKGESVSGNFETSVTGSRWDIGFGAEVSVCSVNFGFNAYYSRLNFKFDEAIYSDIGEKTLVNEACVEIYMGIPIEWIAEPDIF